MKDTYKYKAIRNGIIIEKGTTHDLERRTSDVKARFPDATVKQVGGQTTFKEAEAWLAKQYPSTLEIASIPTKNYKEVIQVRVPTRFYWNKDGSFDGIQFSGFKTTLQPWEEDMMRRCLEAIAPSLYQKEEVE